MCTKRDTSICAGCGSCGAAPKPIATTTTRKPVIVAPTLIQVSAEDTPLYRKLIEAAREAAQTAYRPYSNYNVGASVLTFDGRIYKGCNVENAGYTQTKHAEEVALTSAVADGLLARAEAAGLTQFQAVLAVAVHAPRGSDPWPCSNCRQSLSEFGYDMHIIGVNPQSADDTILCLTLGQLIPFPFPIEEVLASVRKGQ